MERAKITETFMDHMADKLMRNSFYGYDTKDPHGIRRDIELERRRRESERFIAQGDIISHFIMKDLIINDDGTERPLKLKDICFGRPFQGLVQARPSVYGVTSVHYIAGYKIVIKRFEDSRDDTVWYDTPINNYYCSFDELEEIIHEHLLEAIQRDSVWNRIR